MIGIATLLLAAGLADQPQAAGPSPRPGERAAPETFERGLEQANANVLTPEGRSYDAQLAQLSPERDTPLMDACFLAVKKPDPTSFRVVFRLAADGAVEAALVRPDTALASCFRDKLKAERFPRPPRGGYWVLAEMKIVPPKAR